MDASREHIDRVDGIAPEIIRVAVARVVASSLFEKQARQARLLRFLVDETIEGRRECLSMETALAALYQEFDPAVAERIVRSDFVRLADLLASYFGGEGRDDALTFSVDPKRFSLTLGFHEQSPEQAIRPKQTIWSRHWALLAALGVFAVTAAATLTDPWGGDTPAATSAHTAYSAESAIASSQAPRAELLPAAAQLEAPTAAELDLVGRNHLFAFMSAERQKHVVEHSQAVIAKYPEYSGSFATAAHSLSSMAILMRGSGKSRVFLGQAQAMLDQAQALAPEDSWTLSAAGWVAYAGNDWDMAKALGKQAYELSQGQRHQLIFYGLICLFTGDFETAALISDPSRSAFATGNPAIHGYAALYLKDYASAVASFELASRLGIEQNAVRAASLAAAYHAEGRFEEAQQMIVTIKHTWPTFRPELVHGVFAPDIGEAHQKLFLDLLMDAGWAHLE